MSGEKRNDFIYRAIVFLMALDIVLGAGIGAVGYALLGSTSIALAGAGLSICGMVLLLFFELLGRRSL